LLPRDGGVRPRGARRARRRVERPARRAPVEHVLADPLGPGPARRVLITGAGGQLGHALAESFAGAEVTALTRAGWDVVGPAPPRLDPDLVLHAAAWTRGHHPEADPPRAAQGNETRTAHA